MNRKLAYRFIARVMLLAALMSPYIWATPTTELPAPVSPTVARYPENLPISINPMLAKSLEKLITYKYGELSRILPSPAGPVGTRPSDKAFDIWFVKNTAETSKTYADIRGTELRIYDLYLQQPMHLMGVGLLVHEVTHLLQGPYRDYTPTWMMEAMAEYFRYNHQEEQNIYWFLLQTRKKLDGLKSQISTLEKAVESGDLQAQQKLEEAEGALNHFLETGYRENSKEPVHSAGLFTLIDDDSQIKKGQSSRNKNFKAVITGESTTEYGAPMYQLDVQVRMKNLINKVYYVSTLSKSDKKQKQRHIIDLVPHPEAKQVYKLVTVYDHIKQLQDNRMLDVPEDFFLTKLHQEMYSYYKDRQEFRSDDLDGFLARTYGVDLTSYWREYLARAAVTEVPLYEDIQVEVADKALADAAAIARSESDGASAVKLEKKLIFNIEMAARKAIQAPYIQREEEEASAHKWKTHAWAWPYIIRMIKSGWFPAS